MRKSVICILGIIFIIMFAITSTTFGADLVNPNTAGQKKFNNLPNIIKIDPNVIRMKMYNNNLEELKRDVSGASEKVATASGQLRRLESTLLNLKQKEEECMNKPFTQADIVAAGCSDKDNMLECSQKLFDECVRPTRGDALSAINDVNVLLAGGLARAGAVTLLLHADEILKMLRTNLR